MTPRPIHCLNCGSWYEATGRCPRGCDRVLGKQLGQSLEDYVQQVKRYGSQGPCYSTDPDKWWAEPEVVT